jgi:hypothetical protein
MGFDALPIEIVQQILDEATKILSLQRVMRLRRVCSELPSRGMFVE